MVQGSEVIVKDEGTQACAHPRTLCVLGCERVRVRACECCVQVCARARVCTAER